MVYQILWLLQASNWGLFSLHCDIVTTYLVVEEKNLEH